MILVALDENIILAALQFSSQNIYQSCDLGHAAGQSNVNVSQYRSLFTDGCVTSVKYRFDVKRGSSPLGCSETSVNKALMLNTRKTSPVGY